MYYLFVRKHAAFVWNFFGHLEQGTALVITFMLNFKLNLTDIFLSFTNYNN